MTIACMDIICQIIAIVAISNSIEYPLQLIVLLCTSD